MRRQVFTENTQGINFNLQKMGDRMTLYLTNFMYLKLYRQIRQIDLGQRFHIFLSFLINCLNLKENIHCTFANFQNWRKGIFAVFHQLFKSARKYLYNTIYIFPGL